MKPHQILPWQAAFEDSSKPMNPCHFLHPNHRDVNAMPAIEASGAAAALERSVKPIELSFPLPKAPETKIHVHLTVNTTSIVLFLTTVYGGDIPTGAPLGSFVYALPDVSGVYNCSLAGRLTTTAEQPWSDPFDTPLHLRVLSGIYYSSGEVISQENIYAGVCWKLNEFCKRRHGWYSRGRD
jgi:hypothetical protein